MAYCQIEAVTGRAGWLSDAWRENSKPALADIEGFIEDVAGEIDGFVAGLGVPVPVEGPAAQSLRSLNADGALVLALEATYPGDETPSSAQSILDAVRERWLAGKLALAKGEHPVVSIVEVSGESSSASDFWSENPGGSYRAENPWGDPDPSGFGPMVTRDMSF